MTRPRPLLLRQVPWLVAAVVAVLLALGAAGQGPPTGARVAAAGSALEPAGLRAVRLVEGWHAARARAYASGDVAALGALHVSGSPAGRRDVAVLRAYAARGVGLDLTTRTAEVAVLVSRPRLVVVRERSLVLAVARHHGAERLLPSTGWAWRRLVLRLVGGRWRLSAATGDPSGSPREPP